MNSNIARRLAYRRIFEQDEVDGLFHFMHDGWAQGKIDKDMHNDSIRSVRTQLAHLDGELYEKLHTYVWAANQALWNFDLTGLKAHDPPQVLRYDREDHYDWHIDHDEQSSTRKLTCIVQLSAADSYTGGDIQFFPPLKHSSSSDWRACGTLIIFPVYVPHRLTKIVSGTRHSLIFWIHGPEFR